MPTAIGNRVFLLRELIRRDLTARFAGSFGGPLWAVVNPLLLCLIYGLVFAVILRTAPPAGFPGGYSLFLLGGLIPWIGLQEAIIRSTTSISDQAHLVKKQSFSLEMLPLASLGTALFLEACGLLVLIAYVVVTGHGHVRPGPLAAALAFEVLFLVGPIFALAALNVFFRDLVQVLTPVLMIAFYLSPILYPESLVPARYARFFFLNPLGDMAALFRSGLFGTQPPSEARLGLWCVLFALLGAAGLWLFRRCRPSFADLL